jgi:hypothetical protein
VLARGFLQAIVTCNDVIARLHFKASCDADCAAPQHYMQVRTW